MGYFEALILGLLQGFTEFLPISSSGHLALGHLLFGQVVEKQAQLAFDVMVHGATLVVICAFFWGVFWSLIKENRSLLPKICLGLIPTFLVGFFFEEEMEVLGNSGLPLAFGFLVSGAFLYWLKYLKTEPLSEGVEGVEGTTAVVVGLAQALALVPSISRSGMTISAGRICGLDGQKAVTFSFVLGAPAIFGAFLLKAPVIAREAAAQPGPWVMGFAAALVSGWLAMALLRWLAASGRLSFFAPYCFLAALVSLGVGIWG